jgi:2-keto-4-pentenoate hydratase/2-oxohepta-3-ene-1,7-dioic acid hydratase in catechol pathway
MSRSDALAKAAYEAPADLAQFIAAGKPALELARMAAAHVKGAKDGSLLMPISSVTLQAPWPGRRIFCAGANFAKHGFNLLTNRGIQTSVKALEEEARQSEPLGFTKTLLDVAGPNGDVIYPTRATQLDFEAELAVVIGKSGKDIPVTEGMNYIWGITLANDWSDRGAPHLRFPLSFHLGKNFDGGVSLGPCIVVGDNDPHNLEVTLEVNGKVRQHFSTREMIFSFAEYVAHLSRDMTLAPGDVILSGTGAGTAMDMTKRGPDGALVNLDLFLKIGDVVEVKAPAIGSLLNRIVAKSSVTPR